MLVTWCGIRAGDARHRNVEPFDRDHHVEGVGVERPRPSITIADATFQNAARFAGASRAPARCRQYQRISRPLRRVSTGRSRRGCARGPSNRDRCCRGRPAGNAQKLSATATPIAHAGADWQMRGEDPAAAVDLAEIAARAGDTQLGVHRQGSCRPCFQIRPGIDESSQRRDRVRRRRGAGGKLFCLDIADIIVERGLPRGPAVLFLIDAKTSPESERVSIGAVLSRTGAGGGNDGAATADPSLRQSGCC